ncbi:MAG: tetratricopeptide repeat protein [Candidatus Hodarchaeota archaeon]
MGKWACLNTLLILIFLISCGPPAVPPAVVKENETVEKKPLIDKEQQPRAHLESLQKSRELRPEETNIPEAYDYFKLAEKGDISFVFLGSSDDTSISYLKKAIELDPYYHAAHYCLALSYRSKKLFSDAIKELQKSIEIKPLFLNAYVTLGGIYREIGDTSKAITQYKKALDIDPDNCFTHSALGHTYEEIKIYEKALEKFEVANKICGNNFALVPLARLYFKMKNFDEAINAYKRLIEANPKEVYYRFALAYSYSEAGLRNSAIAEYKKVIEIDPNNAEANYNLGVNLSKSGKKEDLLDAIKYFKTSISITDRQKGELDLKFDAKRMIEFCTQSIEDLERPERLMRISKNNGGVGIIAKLFLTIGDYNKGNNLFISGNEKTKPIKDKYGDYITRYDVSPDIYEAQEYFKKFKESVVELKGKEPRIKRVIRYFLKAAVDRIEGIETFSIGYYMPKKDYKGEFEKGFARIRMADHYFLEGLKLLRESVKRNPKYFNRYDEKNLEGLIDYYVKKYK